MSGGHYDYTYRKMLTMAELISEDIEDKESGMSDGTRILMSKFRDELLSTARKARVLEWVLSGDSSEEYFVDVMKDPFNIEITEDNVWGKNEPR